MAKKKAKKKVTKRRASASRGGRKVKSKAGAKRASRKPAAPARKVAKKKATKKRVVKKAVKRKVTQRKPAKKKVSKKKVARKKVAAKKVTRKKAVKKASSKRVTKKTARPKAAQRTARKVSRTIAVPKTAASRAVRRPPARASHRKSQPVGSSKALKKSEAARFREMLLIKRESLVGDLKSLESQAFKTSGQDASANHMADFGSDNYEQEFTFGLIENDEEAVRQINAALARIDAGGYGLCQGCGLRIPEPRLEVLPWAAYCVQCQEQNERF